MKNFFKTAVKAYFIGVGVLVTLLFLMLYFMVSRYKPQLTQPEPLKKPVVIHMKLQGQILEYEEKSTPFDSLMNRYFYDSENIYLSHLKKQLKEMAKDPLIKGVFLELGGISGSLVAFEELRKLFLQFKAESKKDLHAWMAYGTTKEYFIATVADKVIMPPSSNLTLFGPVVSLVYFGSALKKLGVSVDIIKQGNFKSAGESFIQNDLSPETKLMYESLEKDLRQSLVEEISSSSIRLEEKGVTKLFADSLYNGSTALKTHAIDKVAYKKEALENLEKKLKAKTYSAEDYASLNFNPSQKEGLKGSNGIALIEARGAIQLEAPGGQDNVIVASKLIEELEWARKEEKVKAVVLRISSPGGSAIASDLIWQEVKRLVAVKPVVVSMGATAASGAYYLSTPAKIFASPYTITGSIGVIQMLFNLKGVEEKFGLSFPIITGSERKNLIGMGTPPSTTDRYLLQEESKYVYDTFLARVSKGRKIPKEQVKKIAGGRVWTGKQAKALGLVDEIGGLTEALAEAKKLAGFPKEIKVPVHLWEPPITNLKECLQDMKRCFNPNRSSLKLSPLMKLNVKQLTGEDIHKQLEAKFGRGPQMLWPDSLVFS